MEHTPGPWRVFTDDFGVVGVESDNRIIADKIVCEDEMPCDIDECMDNAKLIAAAPDLLEVCRSAVSMAGNVDHATRTGPNDAMSRGMLINAFRDMAQRALEKIE